MGIISRFRAWWQDVQRSKQMKRRWLALCEALQKELMPHGAKFKGEHIWELIECMYTSSKRHYHDLKHIEHCLAEFDAVKSSYPLTGQIVLELAIWFHDMDMDYTPGSLTNGQKSAQHSARLLKVCGFTGIEVDSVKALILATDHFSSLSDYPLAADITDIDLSIFGQSEEAFDEYDANIRKEYSSVPENKYKAHRVEVLQSFLDRPEIYRTPYFKQKYEAQARKNLQRAIDKLKAGI